MASPLELTNSRPAGPQDVVVTGTFDNWSKTLPLVQQADGSFALTVPLTADKLILYKYVVDGEWLVNHEQKVGKDDNGIDNNILESEDLFIASSGSQIPEAGGLIAAPGSFSTTVMPSAEGQQTTMGEPGIFIPQGEEQLSAFKDVRNVDSREANDAAVSDNLTPEEKQKHKKKLKRLQYKNKKKAQKAAAAAEDGTSKESTPAPDTDALKAAEIAFKDEPATETTLPAQDAAPVVLADPVEKSTEAPIEKSVEPAETFKSNESVKSVEAAAPLDGALASEPVTPAEQITPVELVAPVVAAAPVEVVEVTEVEVVAPVEEPVEEPVQEPVQDATVDTLDPVVVGAIGTEDQSPDALASDIAKTETVEPVIEPAITEPIEVPLNGIAAAVAEPVGVGAEAEPASVFDEPETKAVTTKDTSSEDIVITQGGNDVEAIQKTIVAQTEGDVTVEQLQPTESEARKLKAEANIPQEKPVAKVEKTDKPAAKKDVKEKEKKKEKKEKKGFMAKLKKIFK